jgi:hypothetical protein
MLASNFRFATEDVDVSKLDHPLPGWLAAVVQELAEQNNWHKDWFNDGVAFHLSPLADSAADHLEFGTFSRDGSPAGLAVSVPSAAYLLALQIEGVQNHGPGARRSRAVGHPESDARRRHIHCGRRHRPVGSIFSPQRRFFGEAAVPVKHMNREGAADAPEYPR